MSNDINEILQQRGQQYGDFSEGAKVMQSLKRAMRTGRNWSSLDSAKREALEMIVHKIGRILNGDPDHRDSWHDIGGYARLIEDSLGESEPGEGIDTEKEIKGRLRALRGYAGMPAQEHYAASRRLKKRREVSRRRPVLRENVGVGINWDEILEEPNK